MGLPGLKLVFKIISFLIASFLLIHVMGVFGPFLVVAYPLWWLLVPRSTVCFACRMGEEGQYCQLCRRKINKKNGIFPETFVSALANGAIIFLFSIFSIGIIYVESRVFFSLGLTTPSKTARFLIPTKGQYYLNEVFAMKIELNNITTPINTVRADLGFDPTALEVVELSTKGSFASVFIEKVIDNKGGYLRLSGGLPNPGYAENKVFFATVYFKAKKGGTTTVEFLPSCLALANDGRGTNILSDLAAVSYYIVNQETPQEIKDRKKIELGMVLGSKLDDKEETKIGGQYYLFEEQRKEMAQVLGTRDQISSKPNLGERVIRLAFGWWEKWNGLALGVWKGILRR